MSGGRTGTSGPVNAEQPCKVCGKAAGVESFPTTRDSYDIDCPRCGRFEISRSAAMSMPHLTKEGAHLPRLMAALRRASESGSPLVLRTDNTQEIISAAPVPRTLTDALDRLVQYIGDHVETPEGVVPFNPQTDYPLLAASGPDAFIYYLQKARDLGLVELTRLEVGTAARLDVRGWERMLELRRTRPASRQAFVAMWFSDETRDAWLKGIQPALDETGYDPVRVDLIEHNDPIDDLILLEIRRSGLMVADFTGHRNGVYFEAGFAMGLDIPVIRTCREDEIGELHFDTRQYNHIVWNAPEDLKESLIRRIEATAGQGAI